MFISAWVDQFLNFGNHTTNRVESQHAKLKIYIESPKTELEIFLSHIHQVIQSQDTSIKASFEMSRNIRKRRLEKPHFQNLWGFVSFYALDMIFNEYERSFETSVFSEQCGCKLRTSHGLPCAHEQALYTCQGIPIPLDAIDVFWKKLDFSPSVSAQYDDIQCDDEAQMFREHFNKQSGSGRKSMLKELTDMLTPSKTLFREPSVHKTSRGRPSLKNQALKKILKTLVDIVVPMRQPSSTPGILVIKSQRGITHTSNDNRPPEIHILIKSRVYFIHTSYI